MKGHTQIITAPMGAGELRQFLAGGVKFELIETTGPVQVRLLTRDGSEVGGMVNAEGGIFFSGAEFGSVEIASATDQTVRFFVGDSDAGSRRVTGSVQVSAQAPAVFTGANTQRTVTNATAQLLAAAPGRRYLLVQNKSATGSIFLTFGAGAATVANGLRIGPGGVWEWNSSVPTNAVQAIGDIASNPDVLTVEG